MIPKDMYKHIFWGGIILTLALLGMATFGNEAAVETAQGIFAAAFGLTVVVLFGIFIAKHT